MHSPLVSVGIPTYNRISTLKKTIESVITQTYSNLEIIISDNASSDDTQDYCNSIIKNDKRIRYIRQSHNNGATENFNAVLRAATGEYFMWLGDDDWIDLNYIEECLKIIISQNDFSIVGGLAKYYVNDIYSFSGENLELLSDNVGDRLVNYFKNISYNGIFYGMMKKNNIPFLEEKFGGDWLLLTKILVFGKCFTISDVYVYRRLGGVSISTESMAEAVGGSYLRKKFPWCSLAFSQFFQIIFNPPFTDIFICSRLKIAKDVFFVIYNRYCKTEIYKKMPFVVIKIFGKL